MTIVTLHEPKYHRIAIRRLRNKITKHKRYQSLENKSDKSFLIYDQYTELYFENYEIKLENADYIYQSLEPKSDKFFLINDQYTKLHFENNEIKLRNTNYIYQSLETKSDKSVLHYYHPLGKSQESFGIAKGSQVPSFDVHFSNLGPGDLGLSLLRLPQTPESWNPLRTSSGFLKHRPLLTHIRETRIKLADPQIEGFQRPVSFRLSSRGSGIVGISRSRANPRPVSRG